MDTFKKIFDHISDKVTFDIEVYPCENFYVDEFSEEDAAFIHRRLCRGEKWAWCTVTVTAKYAGVAYTYFNSDLSFEDEAEFKAGNCYKDMKERAIGGLTHKMLEVIDLVNHIINNK